MNTKQDLFCREYLVDLNATKAAIRAGYKEKAAGQYGYELLQKPHIQKRVSELMAERADRVEVTADRVLQELADLAFFDPSKIFEFQNGGIRIKDTADMSDRERRAVVQASEMAGAVVKTDVKLADKISALTLLGKHLKMFTDKTEIGGIDGEKLKIIVKPPEL